MAKPEVETIEITNFGGRLTRILNGEMNSGFSKFANSFGYDPFSKPMNLTWFEQPVDITGPITDLIVAAKKYYGGNALPGLGQTQEYVLLLGNGGGGNAKGNLYVMQPNSPSSIVGASQANVDSVLGSASIAGTYNFGGAVEIFAQPSIAGGDTKGVYVSSDTSVNVVPLSNISGQQKTVVANLVGTLNNATGAFRPMKVFQGGLRVSNASTIFTIGPSATVTSPYNASIRGVSNANSDFQTPLPVDAEIQDMDVSIDGNYLQISTSNVDNEQISVINQDFSNAASSDGVLYGWNGADPNVTTSTTMPSSSPTALQIYLGNNMFFSNDSFGSSVNNGVNKLLTMFGNKSPFANATAVNGNFLSWIVPEIDTTGEVLHASMYYFGGLDEENPKGLYRVMIQQPIGGGFAAYQTPLNIVVDNLYSALNQTLSAVVPLGYGKHYFSAWYPNNLSNIYKLYRFSINSTGTGTPQQGIYETQTQLFSKRISITAIRVYTEPTATGNSFNLDLIGSDGQVITNGNFSYSYVAGTDITKLQGPLERINFNPGTMTTYALGLRVTNKGTTNMTIKKIEVDYSESGK